MSQKVKDFTHEDMLKADKKNFIYPIIYSDEQFIQISIYIPEIAYYYYISNYGRVFSCVTGRICGTSISNAGYECITLRLNDKTSIKSMSIHRLVLRCFIPIPNASEMHVNHINGNKLDNRLINLEWVTQSENMVHCYRNDLEVHGVDHPWSTLTEEQVHEICRLLELGKCDSDIALIMFNDIHRTCIINCIRHGRSWVKISQNYNIPEKATYNNKRQFTDDELRIMNHYVSLGMDKRDVAIASGIDIDNCDEKERQKIYRVIRNLRDKKAYQYLFDE